jgi:hypothetical protein
MSEQIDFIYFVNQVNHSLRSFNNHELFMYVYMAMKVKSVATFVAK